MRERRVNEIAPMYSDFVVPLDLHDARSTQSRVTRTSKSTASQALTVTKSEATTVPSIPQVAVRVLLFQRLSRVHKRPADVSLNTETHGTRQYKSIDF